MGKGNYYTYAAALFGATLAPEGGVAGWSMPGVSNIPQAMLFEQTHQPASGVFTRVNWFRAEGIPLSHYDFRDHAQHPRAGPLAVSLFCGSRRTAMFRLPRLDARGVSQHARE